MPAETGVGAHCPPYAAGMTLPGGAGAGSVVADPPRRTRRAARAVAVGLVLLLAVVALWQWRSPRAFGEQGSRVGMYNQVGTTALVGVLMAPRVGDPGGVTVHDVEPQVVEGDATVEAFLCRRSAGDGALGAARGEVAARYCESQRTPAGARMGATDDLVLRIHATEPGKVVVEGVEITYSHGWRRGSQVTGMTVVVEFGTMTVEEHLADG